MSCHVPLKVFAGAFAGLMFAGPVLAEVRCPALSGGSPLRSSGGGTLYEGPVKDNASLAPLSTTQGPAGWVNTWRFPGPVDVTLVCRYQNPAKQDVLPLPPTIRSCRQDARSFVCQ